MKKTRTRHDFLYSCTQWGEAGLPRSVDLLSCDPSMYYKPKSPYVEHNSGDVSLV